MITSRNLIVTKKDITQSKKLWQDVYKRIKHDSWEDEKKNNDDIFQII